MKFQSAFFDSANPVPKYDWTGNTHLKIAFGVLVLIPLVMFIAGFMVLTGITGLVGLLFGLLTYFACSIGIWYVIRELFLEHTMKFLHWSVKCIQKDAVKAALARYKRQCMQAEAYGEEYPDLEELVVEDLI